MHVPDGFLDAPTSVATGVVAAVGVSDRAAQGPHRARRPHRADGRPGRGVRVRRPDDELPGRRRHQRSPARRCAGRGTRRTLDRRALHQRGARWSRALFMADGGITALGTNIMLMGLVGVFVGWFVFKAVLAVLPKDLASVPPAAAIGALVSVPVAATVVHRCCSRSAAPCPSRRATCSSRWSAGTRVIGIGEAVVTGLVVGAVVAVPARPRLRRARPARGPRARDPDGAAA